VQPNDNVVIGGHIGPVIFRAARNATKNPAPRIHDVAVDVVPLTQNAGQHALPACDIGGASGLREAGGNEVSGGFEPSLVAMKTMCRHPQAPTPVLPGGFAGSVRARPQVSPLARAP
jgi:hypothetical protein